MSDESRGARPEPPPPAKPRIASRRGIPAILALSGAFASLLGIFLGRGLEQGMGMILTRMFLLVIGFSVLIAGIVGLAAKVHRGNGEGT